MAALIREWIMHSFSFILKLLALVIPKQKNLVLFGAHNGRRFSDNPAVLYSHILKHDAALRAVWLTNEDDVIKKVKAINGEVYKRRSIRGIYLSLICQVYITSHNVKDVLMYIPIKKTPRHIYLHHGIPLRKGWLSVADADKKSIRSTMDKINTTNHMIAPSRFAAEMQNKLLPIGLAHFALTGLPRNDVFFSQQFDRDAFKEKHGLSNFDKIVLYAPTWRPWGSTDFFPFEDFSMDMLKAYLAKQNMCLLLRPHHVDLNCKGNKSLWDSISDDENIRLVTHDIIPEVNEICKIADGLITDYSSLYFDYLIINRPIIFLDYDYDRYNSDIGFYEEYHNITFGERPKSQKAFMDSLQNIKDGKDLFYKERSELRNRFYDNLDGKSIRTCY